MYKRLLFHLILIISFSLDCMPQGLFFQGIGTDLKERSSFSVFDHKACVFANNFEVSFKISLYDVNSFGCIFLLKDTKTGVEYNLMHMRESNDYNLLKFNIGTVDNLLTIRIKTDELKRRQWIDFSSRFDLDGDSVCITIDGQSYSQKNISLPTSFEADLTFGFIKSYVELPPFAIRGLKVGNDKRNYSFSLDESSGNDVHDSKGNIVGYVSNPVWMINDAYHWKLRFSTDHLSLNGANYQTTTQDMLFFHQDSIRSYNMFTNQISSYKYINRSPLSIWLGVSFLDERNNKLYVYEVHDCKDCEGAMSSLDLIDYRWKAECNDRLPMQLHHHSGYLDTMMNRYIIFGGFGNRMYNRNFFTYDLSSHQWDTIPYIGDKISPRYFQGMGESNNSLYIFGGMGNDSGDQEIGRRNYYDLHKLDLIKDESTKLWEIDWGEKNKVVSRNMVVVDDSLLFALCYPEYESNTAALLYKFSVKDGTYEVLGDSIYFCSDEILTNINLFFDDVLQEFYCVVQEVDKDNQTKSSIYSLAYPGASKKDLLTYQKSDSFGSWSLIITICLLISFCLLVLSVYWFFLRKNRRNKRNKSRIEYSFDSEGTADSKMKERKNGIYLFGEFTLYDKAGKDVTYMLSTRLKNTFLLLLEYSLTKGGITSLQLSNMLWSDKDEYSAKNLRGVTINQLRKILSELDGLTLVFDKGFYSLTAEKECFCDCKYLLDLIDLDMSNTHKFAEINDILSRGEFLKLMDEPVLVPFEKFMKEKLAINLPMYVEEAFKMNDYPLVIQLSEQLLAIDSLNITVLSYQLRSLYYLNQESEARRQYTLFAQNYNKINKKQLVDLIEILNYTR